MLDARQASLSVHPSLVIYRKTFEPSWRLDRIPSQIELMSWRTWAFLLP